MDKKHILILAICSLGMLSILFGLYAVSPLTKAMYRGGFDRKFLPQDFIESTKVMKLPYNSYYLAGSSARKAYLGNWTNPFHLIILDLESLDSQHVALKIDNISSYKDLERFRLQVDSPYFYLTHGTMPSILRGNLNDKIAHKFMNDSAFFADAVPISKSSFVLRSYNTSNKSFELAKEVNDATGFKYNYDILKKQRDGIFCVEGMLHFNKDKNEILYLYTYRNQYMVTDSSLNLKYTSNTIDTFSHARVKVADITSDNSKMLTGLPNIVNSLSDVDQKFLFVKSNILAKNEDAKSFVEGATFDIYNTDNGTYVSSFNLHNQNNKIISSFKINKNNLIAIYGEYLIIHSLKTEYL